ncbi:Rft protein-domain-containing protein [Chytriomyces sp. MP71]|nr:Rft protein-domain-containing protein [Chytriomyces sp. MP71]
MVGFASGAAQLMALNAWSRLLTFALNQLALRYITRNVLGIVGVEMELLLATVLFLSRECIRMALLRCEATLPLDDNGTSLALPAARFLRHQRIVNFAYLPIAFGAVIIAAIALYLGLGSHSLSRAAVFSLAAFLELLAEPFYILATNNMYMSLRVRIEGLAVLVKCFVTIALLRAAPIVPGTQSVSEKDGVFAFAWSQVAYGLVLWVCYAGYFFHLYRRVTVTVGVNEGKTIAPSYPNGIWLLTPRKINDVSRDSKRKVKDYYFDPELSSLAWTFAKQGFFKYVLTEGDKILSVALITEEIQGDYSLVEKYGSIIARLLFQPIEEMSRVYFSKLLPTTIPPTPATRQAKRTALTVLTLLLRLYTLLSLTFLAFGPNYAALLIDLLASRTFSSGSAPSVLAVYCLYVPLLAANGVTEAFLQSVAPQEVLLRQSAWMGGCWVAFFVCGWVTIRGLEWGGVGIVVANCVNMGLRIWFAWSFADDFCRNDSSVEERSLHEKERVVTEDETAILEMLNPLALFPRSPVVWLAFAAAFAITCVSNIVIGWQTLKAKALHVAVGGVSFCVVAGVT